MESRRPFAPSFLPHLVCGRRVGGGVCGPALTVVLCGLESAGVVRLDVPQSDRSDFRVTTWRRPAACLGTGMTGSRTGEIYAGEGDDGAGRSRDCRRDELWLATRRPAPDSPVQYVKRMSPATQRNATQRQHRSAQRQLQVRSTVAPACAENTTRRADVSATNHSGDRRLGDSRVNLRSGLINQSIDKRACRKRRK